MVLGGRDTSLIDHPESVWRDSRGRYFVLQPNKEEMPIVFDRGGRFLRRIGRKGDGPGEFRFAAHGTVDAADSIFIVDWVGRASVFSPDFKYVRSFPFPQGVRSMVVLRNGDLLANALVSDRQTIGLPFHLFRRDGNRYAAAGDRSRPYIHTENYRLAHRVTPAAAGGFWSVPRIGDYHLEYWNALGKREAHFRSSPDWFVELPPDIGLRDPFKLDPPVSMIEAIWEDRSGLVWVVTRVADPKRHLARQDTVRTPEGKAVVPSDLDRTSDSIIEVIDPRTHRVMAWHRFDEYLHFAVGGGRVANVRTRPDGFVTIRIMNVSLVR
ncbi:MAG: 6-bladed beta-propeller [Gemmatimonadales bacterium]|nr:6-bladed beta-propeller [Gemmatimonadales bacterium]